MNKIETKCLKEIKQLTHENCMANVYVGQSVDSALRNLRDYSLNDSVEGKEKILDLIIKDLQEIKKQNDIAKDANKSATEWLNALEDQV